MSMPSIPTLEDLMNQDLTLNEAAFRRLELVEAAAPQERFWIYAAERSSALSLADRLSQTSPAAADADLINDIMRYLAMQVASCTAKQDDILLRHGEMRVIDPDVIERLFSNPDIKPLWR
jgi:hypothetical protein